VRAAFSAGREVAQFWRCVPRPTAASHVPCPEVSDILSLSPAPGASTAQRCLSAAQEATAAMPAAAMCSSEYVLRCAPPILFAWQGGG